MVTTYITGAYKHMLMPQLLWWKKCWGIIVTLSIHCYVWELAKDPVKDNSSSKFWSVLWTFYWGIGEFLLIFLQCFLNMSLFQCKTYWSNSRCKSECGVLYITSWGLTSSRLIFINVEFLNITFFKKSTKLLDTFQRYTYSPFFKARSFCPHPLKLFSVSKWT